MMQTEQGAPPATFTYNAPEVEYVAAGFETSADTAKIDDAFAKAQSKFMVAIHDKTGARGNSYATVGSMFTACRQALGEEKIHVMQFAVTDSATQVRVITRISHAGQFYQSVASMPVTQPQNPQSHGSSYTYLRRYALMAMLGLVDAETDDDGAGGVKPDADPIASAKEPAKAEKKEVKTPKLSPMEQVGKAVTMHGRDRALVGLWIRAAYPGIGAHSMTQAIADRIIQKIIDTPDEGFQMEIKDSRSV